MLMMIQLSKVSANEFNPPHAPLAAWGVARGHAAAEPPLGWQIMQASAALGNLVVRLPTI